MLVATRISADALAFSSWKPERLLSSTDGTLSLLEMLIKLAWSDNSSRDIATSEKRDQRCANEVIVMVDSRRIDSRVEHVLKDFARVGLTLMALIIVSARNDPSKGER